MERKREFWWMGVCIFQTTIGGRTVYRWTLADNTTDVVDTFGGPGVHQDNTLREAKRAVEVALRTPTDFHDLFNDNDDTEQPAFIRIHCGDCAALCINGVPCHETGCPSSHIDLTTGKPRPKKCFECGCEVPEDGVCCPS